MEKEKNFLTNIDESIEINIEQLPQRVVDIINELVEIHKEGDWFKYDMKFDELEIVAKKYVINNIISQNTYDKLLMKYGGLYDTY